MTVPMSGLTVRWSLAGCPAGVPDELIAYVADSSHRRFQGAATLRFKTWRMRRDDWFEGCYVFADPEARSAFQESFTATAAQSPVSQIVGSAPMLIEACEIVGIAEGAESFTSAASYDG
ncbi:hypothetical protein [Nocardioides terrisoli]|uniref:hypothetical protein n=1 Tax=Nocardioides terrisoli TaxID=3388267 RepID=UPI00287B7575|nr:hypothetical protein [Nocardioides marmorisolisilvae]